MLAIKGECAAPTDANRRHEREKLAIYAAKKAITRHGENAGGVDEISS
jgi:hypothetical protein